MVILGRDLQINLEELLQILEKAAAGESRISDFNFSLKSSVRSLFGLAEAVSNSMAAALLESGFPLDASDRAVLMERDYDSDHDICLSEARRYPLGRRLQVCFRLFPVVCGSSPPPSWDSTIKIHFRNVTHARNRFTHPTRFEDLYPHPAFESFRHVAIWLPGEVCRVLAKAALGLGLPGPKSPPIVAVSPLSQSIPRPESIFDEEFYHQVFANPAAAIRYIGLFSTHLHEEIEHSFSLCRAALQLPYRPEVISRAIREVARAITTNVEGTIGFTSFFMRAVRRSGVAISIPQRVRGESVPDRLVRTLEAFSDAFGEGHQIAKNNQWLAICSTFEIRDKLTHPRSAANLDLDLPDLDTLFSALDWFLGQASPAVFLDDQKIGDCFGSRRPLRRATGGTEQA